MKKNAFTLIELLAVIAILTIIMVISVPQLITSIKNKKNDALEKTKDLIISAARNYVIDYKIKLPVSIEIETLCQKDYIECPIINPVNNKDLNGYINVNKDKIYVYSDTKMSITLVDYITNLYEDSVTRESNGLKKDNTTDQNIRYYGSNPNNYVRFNNELWRIIGVFGNNVKLVRKDALGSLSWDSSESSVNNGYGINQWGESTYTDGTTYEGSDLMQYLNKMYYKGETVTCYNGYKNTTKTCPTNTLDAESKTLIDNHTWNTGAPNYSELYDSTTKTLDTLEFYKAERGSTNGKICSSGTYCNDTVNRTTEWTGYVGLPYITDWAYASSESDCETKIDQSSIYKCKNNNWMHRSSGWTWYLSPFADSGNAYYVWYVYGGGSAYNYYASNSSGVAPAIYLKSNVLISSGNGSETNPYILTVQ